VICRCEASYLNLLSLNMLSRVASNKHKPSNIAQHVSTMSTFSPQMVMVKLQD